MFTRRQFLATTALAALLEDDLRAADELPHFKPRAKRVIYLFQYGGPSQLDLFDPKPALYKLQGGELPASIRMGQRLTTMTAGQSSFPIASSIFPFRRRGNSGAWVSDLLPYTAAVADDLAFIRSMHTEQINHDPGLTFFQTGFQLAGRPSIGSWISYGLGSENKDLPAYVVLTSLGSSLGDQPLAQRVWGSGFLPTRHQGVQLRSGKEPVFYLANPPGFTPADRRRFLDDLNTLNQMKVEEFHDPEIATRIAQYELAYRMQAAVPELADLSKEPDSAVAMYGPDVRKPGTYAANCLLARRLAERGVRFIQLFHRGWDQHVKLPDNIRYQCQATDQSSAALIQDLKQRGLLDDTLVIWGGEFGRTVYCQGRLTDSDYGRDHHPRCFTIWMAGGGVKGGLSWGSTDDFSYNITENPVHVHDLHATVLHCLGIDHTRLTYKYQGRHFRLTDVSGQVIRDVLS
jgi:hypothetical protein